MDTNRQIVKAVLQKDYATLKESVFAALYTKAGQAMEQAKAAVCEAVFNPPKGGEQLDEAGVGRLKRLTLAWAKAKYGSKRAGITNPEKAKRLGDALAKMKAKVQAKQRKRNFAPPEAFGMTEEVDQLNEVSPPGMEKMTGSKKTKASFAKQYGKRGKSVMYATAWKLHNKKAQD